MQNILVATSRSPHEDTSLRYGDRRSDQLYFDAVDVWTPANRKPGTVNYPSKEPDPDHEFGVVSINSLSRATFEQTVKARLDDLDGDKIVFIFVHGYNVPYANGIYRHAQLLEDFDARGLAIHYSWPSSGRSLGYLYDRDSVQFARDGFVSLLTSVAASEADSIFVMGHSMGTLLVMESIRQLSLSQHADVLEKISPLVLASPDIDIDVFRAQLRVIEPRPDPIVVFVSRKDGALKLSEQLRGGRARVGDGSNIPALQEAGIVVIDLSDIDVGEGTKHGAFASSPALIRALKEVNVAQDTQRSADNQEFDPIAPLVALRDLTAGIVHLPKAVGSDDEVK
ncbi:MAG: alpha/beta fold hydrolase [Pseudomonadota bacterium]